MSTALTPGQHALLQAELQLSRQRVQRALQAQLGGSDRVGHAAALLEEDSGEWPRHEADRELDQARGDRLLAELGEIDDALMRLKLPGYGRCIDCADVSPFDRLQRQPQALRCVDCQARSESGH